MKEKCKNLLAKAGARFLDFKNSERGDSNIVAIVLIIVVVIALVAIFRTRLTAILGNVFDQIDAQVGGG